MRRLCTWIATGFGLGYCPVASGTVGALLGIPIIWAMAPLPLWGQIALALVLSVLCIPICSVAEKALGGQKDDGRIVADEYLTFPLCMLGLPWLEPGNAWMLPMAFVVSRIMDIAKPFPAYRLQALKSGLGITIDDIVASLYALAANWVIVLYIVPRIFGPHAAY